MAYQIHELEQLTGIKAHTLRIWEKRYGIIAPHRTETNIRYYDDEQARKLLNIAALVNSGHKISHVAVLNEEELHSRVSNLQLSESAEQVQNAYITGLVESMLSFNEEEFERLLDRIMVRYGVRVAMLQFVYPFLLKVGVLWSTNEAMPAQEHFASIIIRRKLIAETTLLPPAAATAPKVLLFLPPDEWHEIGLLLADFLVREAGFKTVYLGQSVPFENVLRTCQYTRPVKVISFFILPKKKIDIPKGFAQLAEGLQGAELIVCGREEMLEQIPASARLQRCTSPGQMVALLNSL